MKQLFWALATAPASVFADAAQAQTLGAYYMSVHPQDLVNAQGQRLGSMGAVLQQDRANYHQSGNFGPSDSGDLFFDNAQLRAQIPALFAAHPRNIYFNRYVGVGNAENVVFIVLICGSGGRIEYILMDYAEGDGATACEDV